MDSPPSRLEASILIANRGEIAARAIRTFRKAGCRSIAVHSEPDHASPHVDLADEAHLLGPGPVAESYLRQDLLLEIARNRGADAIFPGYGLLSENASFAEACEHAGIHWLGPDASQIKAFGLKHEARRLAGQAGVPLVPGTGLLENADLAVAEAASIGWPVMLKSTAGGGGIGMSICRDAESLRAAFSSVVGLSQRSFGSGGVFLERYIERGRHVEVQIFGDGRGRVLALGERDCSVQRRNQKVFEETPAPDLPAKTRAALHAAAIQLGESVNYRSAGTVEFLYDADLDEFFFLEVNTRLQVEHGVTELVTGIDLVEWMLRLALDPDWQMPDCAPPPRGHAIQARVYAEDPNHDFRPCCGLLTEAEFPSWTRCDGWVSAGTEVSPYYDPLLCKVMVHAADRQTAVADLSRALRETRLSGFETNLRYLRAICEWQPFRQGGLAMRDLAAFTYLPATIDVITAGTMTSLQDWPGRTGYWQIGVPPSGPFDSLSLRIANRIVGNPEGTPALEITMSGPTLRFNQAATVALVGARASILINGRPAPMGQPIPLAAGDQLQIGRFDSCGARAYLAVAGGIESPLYLGSASTFTLGGFGGPFGRALLPGDVLGIHNSPPAQAIHAPDPPPQLPLGHHWTLGVLYGPHGEPDFFLDEDIKTFFASDWEVHYNSARTGVRLIGPKPKWARSDGGEAGLHPSNLHDNAYAIGAVDFTGDMPVILGPDGPSLGGFVCPCVVAHAELWKLGQLRPGDRIRFIPVDESWAAAQETAIDRFVRGQSSLLPEPVPIATLPSPILHHEGTGDDSLVIRRSGDRYLLLEFGPHHLDLKLRFKVHVVHEWLQSARLPGIMDLTPGIRSLQVHFDPTLISRATLIETILKGIASLPPLERMEIPARIVHLPLSWDDPSTREAIERYMRGVRADAPWCPSNLEFIRRINGLDSIDDVRQRFFSASYLVMGLGDVYLGAPVATPLDPRHRMVTTKYNPARTWTPENAVGIGGAYLCVYGMEGPGGYQFTGRTIQMWNRWHKTADFQQPWLLRFFDQLRFHPVSAEELLRLRRDFPLGRHHLSIEPTVFRLADYEDFLTQQEESIEQFRHRQRAAFHAERERWEAAGIRMDEAAEPAQETPEFEIPPDGSVLESPVAGNVWKCTAGNQDTVAAGDTLLVLEAMKMEIPVTSPTRATIQQMLVSEGSPVRVGQALAILTPAP